MPVVALLLCVLLPQEDAEKGIRAADFRKHIEFLASDEMKGRDNDTPEGRKAAEYVAERMKEIGLDPAGTKGYFQEFAIKRSSRSKREYRGINVVGRLTGSDEKLRDEIIVINAHHDGRGVIRDGIQNGADDNASGVAMVLELAEAFVAIRDRVRRTLVFVSFDCEEDGLLGSRAFVNEAAVDMKKVVANICFDLIGGDFFPWEKSRIYALGSESSPDLAGLLKKHVEAETGLEILRTSVAVIEPFPGSARSDYANFRKEGVPFVFFSTATPWYYHTEWDDLDKINWKKIEGIGRFCFRYIRDLAGADARPKARRPDPKVSRDDLVIMQDAVGMLLEHREDLRITEKQTEEGEALRKSFVKLLGEKEVAEKDMVRVAQRAMILLFRVAAAQRPE